jgi:hypothetical protein
MNLNIPFVMTKSGINVYIDGKMESVANDHPNYDRIYDGLTMGTLSKTEVSTLVNVAKSMEAFSKNRVRVENDSFYWDGVEMANALTLRIMDLLKKGKSIDSLVQFMGNLMENPSFRAVNELYGFLDACTLPITPDGCFLAYKKVGAEYKSIHKNPDGTSVDNAIGLVVKMPRNMVDEDSERACSNGLHCCSFGYLSSYGGGAFDKIVIVKVNPRDVVAVPKDYNNQKMRVCEYLVVGELPNDQVTELRDKYTTEDYSYTDDDDFDEDISDDDFDAESVGGEDDENPCDSCDEVAECPIASPTQHTSAPKKEAPIGDWECRDRDDISNIKFYGNMTQNQAKAAFSRSYGVKYTNVRVRKA